MTLTVKKVILAVSILALQSYLVDARGDGEEVDGWGDDAIMGDGLDDFEEDYELDPSSNMFKIYEMDMDLKSKPSESKFLQSFVELDYNTKPAADVTAFSYCFRFEFFSMNYQCLFYEGHPDVKIHFPEPQKDYGFIYFLGNAFIFQLPTHMHIYPKEWYHMCVSHELKSKQKIVKAYINGEKIVDSIEDTSKTSVKFSDTWTLGFCKYYKEDGHTVLSPLTTILRGAISDFNLWSKALAENEMISFTKTCTRPGIGIVPAADLIIWKEVKEVQKGSEAHSLEIPWVCKTLK